MKNPNIEHTVCPFCKSIVEVNVKFAKSNGRIFCNSCCKAFDIHIEDDEPEEKKQDYTPPQTDDYDYGW